MVNHRFSPAPAIRFLACAFVSIAGFATVSKVFAQDRDPTMTPVVAYDPTAQSVQGLLPLVKSHAVTITAPSYLPKPTKITFRPTISGGIPAGVAEATALSYLSFSPSTLTFTRPGERQIVNVTVNMPNGTVPGSYTYKFFTDGWPVGADGLVDAGSAINANVSLPNQPPPPILGLATPQHGSVITVQYTALPLPVPFTFTAAAPGSAPSPITSAMVTLDGHDVAPTSLSGLNTTTLSGAGTLFLTKAGEYTLTVSATNAGGTSSTSLRFTLVVLAPPPNVSIEAPLNGTRYTYESGDPLNIPVQFSGRSTASVIRSLTATLDGREIVFNKSQIGTPTAIGSTHFALSASGVYRLKVTARDDYGTAEATAIFAINVDLPTGSPVITGSVFFDPSFGGSFSGAATGLAGVTVRLMNGSQTIASTLTAQNGAYSFTPPPGAYLVVVDPPPGMSPTNPNEHPVTVGATASAVPPTGLGLNFSALRGLSANGMSHGFWKNNVTKAAEGKSGGVQINQATVEAHTRAIATLALSPFADLTVGAAVAILSGTDQLRLQLLASEYNYAHGAYIGGSQPLTFAFIYWGESILSNRSSYSPQYQQFAKDWFDAYNNSYGGKVLGPPAGGS